MFKYTNRLNASLCRQTDYHTWLITLLIFMIIPVMVYAQPPRQPNILILLADDLGWNEIGAGPANLGYGSLYHQTPWIDALAEQGLSFTSAHTQQNCAPTRTALMTGQYATRTKSYNVGSLDRGNGSELLIPAQNIERIQPDVITIAEALQKAGYATAHFGKTHSWLSNEGTTVHGWEQSFAAVERSYLATLINGRWHFEGAKADSLDTYAQPYDAAYLDKLRPFENGYDVDILLNTPKHLTDALADAAIDFMRARITNNQPFFAFVAFHAVHRPYLPRIDIESKYKAIPSADLRHDNFRFAAFVETLDQAVGRITAFLDNPDSDSRTNDSVANNTLVIFLSDNGGSDRDQSPLRERKSTLWEGGIRVPMIARMPGWITPMTSTNESVHVIDLYPTLVELAGGSAPNLPIPDDPTYVLDGESLVRLLDGTQSHLVRNAVYWHFPGYFDGHIPQPLSVIIKRVGNLHYKLHYFYETEHFEFYDLDNDLSEAINLLADTPTCSDLQVASGMAEDLRNWLLDTGADFPLIRATGQPVPPPPTIAIPMSCDHHPASD